MILAIAIFSINCKGSKVSSEECKPIVTKIIDTFEKQAMPADAPEEQIAENKQKFEATKPAVISMIEKECMSGKYDLKCLENIQNIATIQTCKK